ncbi:MAG TPA: Ku protein [Caldimonas sp.]|nr:Ku protein [Caldimonas sp.]
MREARPPAAPVRPFWSGTITFGLVSIPVELVAAVAPRQTSMKLVDEQGHALGRRYWCPKDERLLDNDELVRGYETESGKMVVVTDEEFASVAPEKSRDIELKRFVPAQSIPPFFFDRPYFLAPDERAGKAYALLALTMAKTGKAGIGSFVMRGHEYLVAILAENGILRAHTLRHADELRTPKSIGLPEPGKPDAKLARALGTAIDALAKPSIDPAELADVDAEALHKLAQQKAKAGKGVVAMEALEDVDDDGGGSAEVIDLMQALRKSLGADSGRKAAAKSGAPSEAPAKKTPVKKTAAKKSTARKTAARSAPASRPTAKAARGRRSA